MHFHFKVTSSALLFITQLTMCPSGQQVALRLKMAALLWCLYRAILLTSLATAHGADPGPRGSRRGAALASLESGEAPLLPEALPQRDATHRRLGKEGGPRERRGPVGKQETGLLGFGVPQRELGNQPPGGDSARKGRRHGQQAIHKKHGNRKDKVRQAKGETVG